MISRELCVVTIDVLVSGETRIDGEKLMETIRFSSLLASASLACGTSFRRDDSVSTLMVILKQ